MSQQITKDDYNHLVDLFNRRRNFDVIGVADKEYRALGRAIDILREMLPDRRSLAIQTDEASALSDDRSVSTRTLGCGEP